MKISLSSLAPLCVLSLTAVAAHGQFYKIHNGDVGGSAIGQFTTPLTTSNPAIQQNTTSSFGGLFSFREHPLPFAGIEFNYAFTEFSETYTASAYTARTKTDVHEATAAYLFHPHFRKLQPFIGIGGGSLDFVPTGFGNNQWRSTGLLEAGFDIPTSNPHFGFKVQGRTLIHRAPNYQQPNLGSKTWVATNEPTFGTWYRF